MEFESSPMPYQSIFGSSNCAFWVLDQDFFQAAQMDGLFDTPFSRVRCVMLLWGPLFETKVIAKWQGMGQTSDWDMYMYFACMYNLCISMSNPCSQVYITLHYISNFSTPSFGDIMKSLKNAILRVSREQNIS